MPRADSLHDAELQEPQVIMRAILPLCLFNRHVPRRNRARWDGLSFISTCRWCNARIRRDPDGRWMQDWVDQEQD